MDVREVVCVLGLLSFWGITPAGAQGPAPGQPSGGSGNSGNRSTSPRSMRRPLDLQGPLAISGRIVLETGKPIQESLGIELACESRLVQAIRTDLGGYFTFSLGSGGGSNMDFSASNDSAMSVGRSPGDPTRGLTISLPSCEVRVAVPGYYPLAYSILDKPTTGRLEVGTLRLRRISGVQGSYVSLTSLMVPDNAKKEFEKALKDLEKNRSDSAQQHLEKAVALYAEYAAAWNELGQLHTASGEEEKALDAFEKAIAADSQYLQPYLNLASLQLQNRQWQDAVETARRILELDSSLGLANFIQAVGNFNLHHFDAAEKCALEAEKRPHERTPHVHALLAEIFLQKQDYENAATQMRTYLEEDPQGPFAEQVKKGLEEIKEFAGNTPGPPSAPDEAKP